MNSKLYNEINIHRDEKEFFSVMDSLPFGIILIEINQRIYFASSLAKCMVRKKEVTGALYSDIFHTDAAYNGSLSQNKTHNICHSNLLRGDGTVLPIIKITQTITLNGNKYYLKILIDNSVQAEQKKELSDYTETLKHIIQEKEVTEHKISKESEKFKQLFEDFPDAIFLHDWDGHILQVNAKACNRLGYSKEELKSMNTTDIISYESRINATVILEKLKQEKRLSFEAVHVTKYGKEIPVEIFSKVINFDGRELLLKSARNISKRKTYEKELIEARKKAEESDRLKSAFLNNISHEIRTPLHGIIGFLDFFEDESLTVDEKKQFLHHMRESGDRLLETVTSIIDASKLDSGIEKINHEIFCLNDTLENFIFTIKSTHQKPEIDFRYHRNPEIDNHHIKTDKCKLIQVLRHLIGNAYKFTSKGVIELSALKNKNNLILEVKDTGIGIAPEHFNLIFEKFRQVDESVNRKFEGNGLGLCLAKKTIEAMGGEINVESTLGTGSVFTVIIPNVFYSHNNVKPHDRNKEANQTKTILIAEDDMASYFYMETVLKHEGYQLVHAKNGVEALKKCLDGYCPDLVIMDLKMPKMDGYTATKKIKERLPKTPIIACSADVLNGEKQKSIEAGCSDYLAKPTSKEALLFMVEKHIWKTL